MKHAILVVREFDKFSRILTENGFEVVNYQVIKTFSLEDLSELDAKIANLDAYDGLILTSPKAAEVFLKRFLKNVYRGKIYVLGKRTKALFEQTNFEIVFREQANTAEEFIKSFDEAEFSGKKLLFLRGDKSLRIVPELLINVAAVDEVIVYRTIENPLDDDLLAEIGEKIARREFGWICFFSPSGIEGFINKFGAYFVPDTIKIAAIGRTTAEKAAAVNLKADFISPKANAEDFAAGLIDHIKNIE